MTLKHPKLLMPNIISCLTLQTAILLLPYNSFFPSLKYPKFYQFFVLVTIFSFTFSSVSFAQTTLFDEEVTGFNFSEEEQHLRATYDARAIKFVTFRGLGQESLLAINLFGGISYQANYIRTDINTNGSTAWVGKLAKQPSSAVVFAEYDGVWAGRIQDESGNRSLLVSTDQPDVYALVELGDEIIDEGDDQKIAAIDLQNQTATARNATSICDAGSTCASKVVDIMIVYTAAVVANQGGEAAVLAHFASVIADMNLINTNSSVNHTFNLKATYESNYVETSSSSTDLNWLEADETVLALREAHGVDIVGLITNTPTSSYCGLGNLNTNPTNYSPNSAFSVTAWGCSGSNRTFAHEVGHNMGLRHDRHVDNSNTPCVQAHGYVNQAAFGSADASKRWRTVMAYNSQCSASGFNCSRLGYWSNPNVTNTSDPMGSTTSGSEADASYLLNRAICMIAEFKAEPTCPSVSAVDRTDFICTGGLNTEITNWQNSVTSAATNFAAIESGNTNATVEYSTVMIAGAVTSPNGNTASGIHSGTVVSSEVQTTYAYLRCFGADKISGTGDDTFLLLGTHTLNVDLAAVGTGNGMSTVSITACGSAENIDLTTNATGLPENGVFGWWITEGNPISTTVTDNASLTTALSGVTIGGTLSNTVNNLYESTNGTPLKEYTLPFDCSALDNSKTYYATPVKASSKAEIPDLMCNNLQGNGGQVNFNNGAYDGSGETVNFSSCAEPTSSNPVTFTLTLNLTSYTETLPSNLAVLLRNTANSNLIFLNNSIAALPTVLTYTEADFPANYDPRVDGLKIFFVNFNSPYSAGNPTIAFNYDLDITYPGEAGITFPGISSYDDCLFGSPVQINCSCTTCPTITSLAGTTPICKGDNTTSLTATGLSDIGSEDIKFVYFTSPQSGAAVYGTPTGTLGTVMNANLTNSGTTATLSNVNYPSTAGTYYVYAILGNTPADANCRPSATTTIVINEGSTAAVIDGDTTICNGESANISVAITGGTSSFTLVHSGGTVNNYVSGTDISVSPSSTTNFTITSVTDANGCVGTNNSGTAAITVNPLPSVNAVSDQSVCAGDNTAAVNFGGTGSSYAWTNNNTSIGLAASGTGNIAAFATTNSGTTTQTATITVTPKLDGCDGPTTSFTITVKPLPSVNAVSDQSVCAGDNTAAVNFGGTGSTYAWTNNNTSIGLAANGTGNIAAFTAVNTGTTTQTATITVTPQLNGCDGPTTSFTITVKPLPSVNTVSNQTVTVGDMTAAVNFGGTGSTYSWTNDNANTGLGVNGTGDIAAFTTTNTGVSTVTVTPQLNGCDGPTTSFTITVNSATATCTNGMLNVDTSANNATYNCDTVSSAEVIPAMHTIIYEGCKEIILKTGFQYAPTGSATFTARIGGCAPFTESNKTISQAKVNMSTTSLTNQLNMTVHPNPTRNFVNINYHLKESATVWISVFDMTGNQIAVISPRQHQDKGSYQQQLQLDDFEGGMYFVVLQTEKEQVSKKMIILR